MKLNTLSLSLSFICSLLLVSCGGRQERDYLYELLRDFETRPFGRDGRSYKLACFDENSVDSVFITLDITKADGEDSVSIRLVDGTPYLSVGSSEPVPPPPPPMPVPLTDDIDELQSLGIGPEQYVDNRSEEEKELEWLEWQKNIQHLRDSLGHPYGPSLRGMICEGRLRVLVYGYPEDVVSSFLAGHKLLYNPDIFRYMAFKEEEISDRMIEYYRFNYVVDSVGNLEYRGYR